MRAIQVMDGKLVWSEAPTPEPGPGEVRIEVVATAVNRADLAQVQGRYPPPPGASPILGLECSGIIEAVGPGVQRWQPGDPVCALLAGGGYAERVVVPAGQVLPIPDGIGVREAAALPEAACTAWLNLVKEGGLQFGERVLLHAGASGVGTLAIQICRVLGASCWVTCGSEDKLARCVELGAEGGFVRHQGRWADAPFAEEGFDLVLDPVGGSYLPDNIARLRACGRLVVIGLLGGRKGELDLGRLMVKRLTVRGSVLRSRTVREKAEVVAGVVREVWPHVAQGTIRPVLDQAFPIARAQTAHERVARNVTTGKVLLDMPGSSPGR